jgi:hypothetical protein
MSFKHQILSENVPSAEKLFSIFEPHTSILVKGQRKVEFGHKLLITRGKSKTLKRLRIQQIFGALALILTGAFMFTTRGNEWIACLTIAAILELYTAFRIPQEEEKKKAN